MSKKYIIDGFELDYKPHEVVKYITFPGMKCKLIPNQNYAHHFKLRCTFRNEQGNVILTEYDFKIPDSVNEFVSMIYSFISEAMNWEIARAFKYKDVSILFDPLLEREWCVMLEDHKF